MTTASPPIPAVTSFVPVLRAGDALPETELRDQTGRRFRLGGTSRGATVVAFFYTRCRDADGCALTTAKFAAMQRTFAGRPTRLVEITLDPAHDTPPVVARYAEAFDANPERWRLASAMPATLLVLERRLGARVSRTPSSALEHESPLIVLDAGGRIADTIAGDAWTARDVAVAARSAERLPVDPIAWARFELGRGIAAACGGSPAARGISAGLAAAIFFAAVAAFGFLLRRITVRA